MLYGELYFKLQGKSVPLQGKCSTVDSFHGLDFPSPNVFSLEFFSCNKFIETRLVYNFKACLKRKMQYNLCSLFQSKLWLTTNKAALTSRFGICILIPVFV